MQSKIKIWIDGVLRNATPTEVKALELVWGAPDSNNSEIKNLADISDEVEDSDEEYYKNYFKNRK